MRNVCLGVLLLKFSPLARHISSGTLRQEAPNTTIVGGHPMVTASTCDTNVFGLVSKARQTHLYHFSCFPHFWSATWSLDVNQTYRHDCPATAKRTVTFRSQKRHILPPMPYPQTLHSQVPLRLRSAAGVWPPPRRSTFGRCTGRH